ncbi:unnamed protein product, partial [Acidithrix sp. C25]
VLFYLQSITPGQSSKIYVENLGVRGRNFTFITAHTYFGSFWSSSFTILFLANVD